MTTPPPNIPNSSPGFVPGDRWDRRAARQQRRYAQMQARQQRAAFRAQMRALRRTSVLGPVLLIALGVVLLLLQIGRLPWGAVVTWYAHWWPLLLVGAGMVLLLEWAFDTWLASDRDIPLARRTVGSGTGFLLTVLILLGLAATGLVNGSTWIRNNFDGTFHDRDLFGLDQVFARRSESSQDLQSAIGTDGRLIIQNPRGSINISGSSPDNQVHINARQRIFAWDTDRLEQRQRREQPRLQTNGQTVSLSVASEGRDETDLTIQLPHQSSVEIRPQHGDITISELRGTVEIGDHTGDIALTALTGPVHLFLRDDNGDVTAHSLTGEVTLNGRTGDLSFSDVSGPVTLHGDFFGTTRLEHVNGAVRFQSSFTDLSCAGIPGQLTVEGRSDLRAQELAGPVVLSTTDRNLNLTGVRGGATLTDKNGSITLGLSDPLGPVRVTTTDGSIHVSVPPDAGFTLAAQTHDGQVNNDFGLQAEEHDNHTSLTGQVNSGGPEVSLQTSEGDVTLSKAGHADWADADDDDARSAVRPSHRDRHRHATGNR